MRALPLICAGRVQDVYLPKDFYTGQMRGIAFIQYDDPRDAEDALAMDGTLIGGREVTVQYAEHGRKRPDQMASEQAGRGGGRGGGYGGSAGRGYGGGFGGGGYRGGGGHDRRRSRSRSRSRSPRRH